MSIDGSAGCNTNIAEKNHFRGWALLDYCTIVRGPFIVIVDVLVEVGTEGAQGGEQAFVSFDAGRSPTKILHLPR